MYKVFPIFNNLNRDRMRKNIQCSTIMIIQIPFFINRYLQIYMNQVGQRKLLSSYHIHVYSVGVVDKFISCILKLYYI